MKRIEFKDGRLKKAALPLVRGREAEAEARDECLCYRSAPPGLPGGAGSRREALR
jgi:hypothetical protein